MDKQRFTLFLIISAMALAGIMIIQLYGIRNAYLFQKEQFGSNVQTGLNNVASRLIEMQVDTNVRLLRGCQHAYEFERQEILPLLLSPVLDEFVSDEFSKLNINIEYDYAVYGIPEMSLLKTSNPDRSGKLLNSPHHVSFMCIYDEEGFNLAVYFPEQHSFILYNVLPWAALLFLLIILLVFAFLKIIRMFLNAKKFSDMKTDFVNNMTHEFKTPIASLSLAADMLMKPEINNQPCQVQRYAKVISDENKRLKSRVEQVMHITMVERGDFSMKMKPVDVHKLVEESLKPYKMLIKQQKGRVLCLLNAKQSNIHADPVHLENAVSNLIDNAIKYSIGAPELTLKTSNSDEGVIISIEDKGVGISAEHQQDIFRRFYRVSTGDVHDAKGFGLGLYYVKTVVEAHQGSIHVKSQPGKGSRFEMFLPYQMQV